MKNKKKTIIEVENINYSIENTHILKNITFHINEGDFVGIVGPNGAGKSTLIKILLKEIEGYKGKIKINGKIGYVPQKETFEKDFPINAIEIVMMGLYNETNKFKKYNLNQKKYAESLLEKLEIKNIKKRQVGKLSGGEYQRLMLARALASKPNILILDEPEAGVDKDGQNLYYKILKELNLNQNITVILVSHDLSMIFKETNKVMCLNQTLHCHKETKQMTTEDLKSLYSESLEILLHLEDSVKVVKKND